MKMNISKNGIDVIKHYERFYANPYLCPAGVATIGYGTTVYPDGKKVRLNDPAITEPEAVELLQHDVENFERDVTVLLKVPVTQHLFDALVSFVYNLGSSALKGSSLLSLINAGVVEKQPQEWKRLISFQFLKWIYAGGKQLKGLIARRSTEGLLATDGVVKFFN